MLAKKVAAFLLFASLIVPSITLAEEELAPGFSACEEKADNMADNIECAVNAYKYWDEKLNANFKKAKSLCADAENPKACESQLLKAQRLWIQYKEAMAQTLFQIHGGGSLARLESDMFFARETKKQAQLLQLGD